MAGENDQHLTFSPDQLVLTLLRAVKSVHYNHGLE